MKEKIKSGIRWFLKVTFLNQYPAIGILAPTCLITATIYGNWEECPEWVGLVGNITFFMMLGIGLDRTLIAFSNLWRKN